MLNLTPLHTKKAINPRGSFYYAVKGNFPLRRVVIWKQLLEIPKVYQQFITVASNMALASLLPLIQPNLLQCPIGPIDTCRSLPSSPIIKLGQASTALAMLIASESMTPTPTQAMINNISVAPSNAWYFSLTPFESILLGLIVLKVGSIKWIFKKSHCRVGVLSGNYFFPCVRYLYCTKFVLFAQLMLLRYVTVLPISINDLANKDYFNFGKKRKRDLQEQFDESKIKKEKERLAEIMFTVINLEQCSASKNQIFDHKW